MSGADALVFTGGIGENSPEIRARSARASSGWASSWTRRATGRAAGGRRISPEGSRLAVWVIPTDEELLIARDTVRCVKNAPRRW